MQYLAFRRVKNHPQKVAFEHLPAEYIVEIAQYDKKLHLPADGWESLIEDKAVIEINKNVAIAEALAAEKKRIAEANVISAEKAEEIQRAKLKDEYLAWKEFLKHRENMKLAAELERKELVEQLDRIRQDLAPLETFKTVKDKEDEV